MNVDVAAIQAVLREAKLDGWLLYDFHGVNPVVRLLLGLRGMATRRLFVFLPATGEPVAVAHRIELQPLEGFPGRVIPYSAWRELEAALRATVSDKRVAMEISQDDSVPYLDRVPLGVAQYLERFGVTIVPSDELVSQFAARWSPDDAQKHRAAASQLAGIAQQAFRDVGDALANGRALSELDVQRSVLAAIERAGLQTQDAPIAAFGPHSANPHYEPQGGADGMLRPGQVVLLDLWGCYPGSVYADQTWMAHAGPAPDDVRHVWHTVRDARDAVIARLAEACAHGERIRGADLDDVARGTIERAGYGEAFVHRTGHSIDRDLHGSGPHLDNYETRDERTLLPGSGFSVEPGVYLPERFGVRSEINVLLHADRPEVTPADPQAELIEL
jgi:Xaa-Pro aminopeptidase